MNGVCERPNLHTGTHGSAVLLAAAVLIVGAGAVLQARRRRLDVRRALALVLVLGAIPGLHAVWIRRPDAPAHLPMAARAVERFESQVVGFAVQHDDCVEVVRRGCEACDPVLWFARPHRRLCASGTARLVVQHDSIGSGCALRDATLTCGEP